MGRADRLDLLSRCLRTRTAAIFGYDAERRQYVYWGFSGRIVSTYAAETIEGTSVTWVGFAASTGNRCTEVFSADGRSSTNTCETSIGGRSPIVRASGTSSKLEYPEGLTSDR